MLLDRFYRKIKTMIQTYILRDKFHVAYKNWVSVNGDKTLRLKYPLNSNSVVFDIGGFRGDFVKDITDKYQCHLHFFEPVHSFCEFAKSRQFIQKEKIIFNNFGLGHMDEAVEITIQNDSTSVFKANNSEATEKITIKQFSNYVKDHNISQIDLIKINIEGGEYPLLNHIIDYNLHLICRNIQIQFHNFFDNSIKERERIRLKLSKTHRLTYDYYFIWENWELK